MLVKMLNEMSVVTVRLQSPVNLECSGTVNSPGTEFSE